MDYNSLNNNAFTFTLIRLPNVVFRAVAVNLPSISVGAPVAPNMQGSQYFPGSATEYDSFRMTFIVDENLSNYEELYRWIDQQMIGSKFRPKTSEEKFLVSDGKLVTMTNASNPNRIISFKDMFPIELGAIDFDTRDTNVEPAICTVEFKFSYFTLEPKNYSTSDEGFIALNINNRV